jgi:ankyrin repeat protein
LEILLDCLPPSVQNTLEELPDSLDETYERILREIRKPNQGLAHRLMHCLVAAVRPLQVKELAEVLAFNFDAEGIPKLNSSWRWEDQEGAVMLACSSLVTIVKDGDSRIVQFSHFSVKEFLTADRLAEPMRDVSRYHIGLEAAHTILAQASLGFLLHLDDRVNRDNIEGFPLALYSAQHWATHSRFGNVSSRIKDWMKCLFDEDKPHFATWLWIHDDDWGVSSFTMLPEKPEAVPLYHAARLGFRDLAEHLITEHPEHINARNENGFAPIHAAAREGHVDILALLLEHGADVDSRNVYNQTPLSWAAACGEVGVGQYLLGRGADINGRNNYHATPLCLAARDGHVEFVRMLLERGARIDVPDYRGRTPLHLAVELGNIEIARLLLEHAVDANALDDSDKTPSSGST